MLITLNVESQDVGEFKEKAEKVYKYFKVKPTFNIDMDIEQVSCPILLIQIILMASIKTCYVQI